ncbi:MAG: hypothetical protein ACRCWB_05835 [Enterovibrio sp.]
MRPSFKLENSYHQQRAQQTPTGFARMRRVLNCYSSPQSAAVPRHYLPHIARSIVVQALQRSRIPPQRQSVSLHGLLSRSERTQQTPRHTAAGQRPSSNTPLYRHYLSSLQNSPPQPLSPHRVDSARFRSLRESQQSRAPHTAPVAVPLSDASKAAQTKVLQEKAQPAVSANAAQPEPAATKPATPEATLPVQKPADLKQPPLPLAKLEAEQTSPSASQPSQHAHASATASDTLTARRLSTQPRSLRFSDEQNSETGFARRWQRISPQQFAAASAIASSAISEPPPPLPSPFKEAAPFLYLMTTDLQYRFHFPHQSTPTTATAQAQLRAQRILAALLQLPVERVSRFVYDKANITRVITSILEEQQILQSPTRPNPPQILPDVRVLAQQFVQHFTAGTMPQPEEAHAIAAPPYLQLADDGSDYCFDFPEGAAECSWAQNCACNILAELTGAPIEAVEQHVTSGASLTGAAVCALQARAISPDDGASAIIVLEDLIEDFIARFVQIMEDSAAQESAMQE